MHPSPSMPPLPPGAAARLEDFLRQMEGIAPTFVGYHAMSEEVLVIRIKDEPGAVARVAARFREPAINVLSLRILQRNNGWATLLLGTSDNAGAREILKDCVV